MENEKTKSNGFVINSPYKEPSSYLYFNAENESYEHRQGRRDAGYFVTLGKQESNNVVTKFEKLDLANKIRPRVRSWRNAGYPNVTSITKKLLDHWNRFDNPDLSIEGKRYFWCQIEAIETLIWLKEASDSEKVGLNIKDHSDSEWMRQCTKLATGTGKTVVMAMIIAWQSINKIVNPKDSRFSKNILVMAPGITVRDRLGVLVPGSEGNYFDDFEIVPQQYKEYLYQAKVVPMNWHNLASKKVGSLPKVMQESMGDESSSVFAKRVLSELPGSGPIVVINDEAHHCHRHAAEIGKSREEKNEEKKENEEATVWISGLDRINESRGIITTYDLSATPFIPKGRSSNTGFELFNWIVSDFGLNDAIECGLVKTPTVAVRDSSWASDKIQGDKSKFFHIYYEEGIKQDLSQKADEYVDLPDLVRSAFKILSADWNYTKEKWTGDDVVPPSMIVICNNTYTSKRIEYSIFNSSLGVPEIAEKDSVIRIDSTADDIDDPILRDKFNTVGKVGKPGENIHCVIGVNMLSEGWDANNVKQILGLRAFTSQLLCEQVIGRGLRRMSYDIDESTGLLKPEYVTVFGVPFSFLPMEGGEDIDPSEEKKKTYVQVLESKNKYNINFPNIIKIQKEIEYYVDINWDKVDELVLSPSEIAAWVQVAPTLERPDLSKLEKMQAINEQLGTDVRLKKSVLQITNNIKQGLDESWNNIDEGNKFQQIYKIVLDYIDRKVKINVPGDKRELYSNIMINQKISTIASEIRQAINMSDTSNVIPVPDQINKFKSTFAMNPWLTIRETYSAPEMKCHVSHLVIDSKWENIGKILDHELSDVEAWVKNDHLGFTIPYIHKGLLSTYFPDFIIKFSNNRFMMLEIKGKEREKDKSKWDAATLWCSALNTDKDSWGNWQFRVIKERPELNDLVWDKKQP